MQRASRGTKTQTEKRRPCDFSLQHWFWDSELWARRSRLRQAGSATQCGIPRSISVRPMARIRITMPRRLSSVNLGARRLCMVRSMVHRTACPAIPMGRTTTRVGRIPTGIMGIKIITTIKHRSGRAVNGRRVVASTSQPGVQLDMGPLVHAVTADKMNRDIALR